MIKPEKLKLNDRVAIVAPSQAAKEDLVNRAIKMVEKLGLTPVVYKSCYLINNEIDVPPEIRAKDINNAFKDPSIKGIISLKAGYGTMHILPFIDYEMIKSNPKVFMGFSNITVLHLALNKFSSLITFHGPSASFNIWKKGKAKHDIDEYTYKSLYKSLFVSEPLGIIENPVSEEIQCLYSGNVEGEIIGGNLTLLVNTLGSKYEIDTRNRILFIEDMGEPLSNIFSMLKKMEKSKKFKHCEGIILGTWIKCGEEYNSIKEREEKLKEIFSSVLLPYKKPIFINLRAGHNVPMVTLPLGVKVKLNGEKNEINFIESATK